MMVPGLYGYCSGTKWVTDLNITTFAAEKAYWTQRGYAEQAAIKTMSRIDVPKPLQQIKAGRTAVAGVAWAPHRGIDAVDQLERNLVGLQPDGEVQPALAGHLAAVGLALGRHSRSPPARGARHRRHRRNSDLQAGLSASERSVRLGQRGGDCHLARIRAIALALIHQPATQGSNTMLNKGIIFGAAAQLARLLVMLVGPQLFLHAASLDQLAPQLARRP